MVGVGGSNPKKDPKALSLQKYHFDSFTTGLDMKMNKVMPKDGEYNWDVIDEVVAFTQENDQRLFGHNLVWHSSTPKWFVKKARENPEWVDGFLRDYIHTYVGRYKGIVDGWDVVNEGLVTKGAGFREDTIWYETMGIDYIEKLSGTLMKLTQMPFYFITILILSVILKNSILC